MVDWKLYIDSPQQRALDLCGGSLTEGDGGDHLGSGYDAWINGSGYDAWINGNGWGYGFGNGWGDGHDMFYGDGNGDGRSETEW